MSKNTILCFLTFILGFVLGILCHLALHQRGHPSIITQVDTVTILKPMAVSETIVREVAVRAPVLPPEIREVRLPSDTVRILQRDTVEVLLPVTQRQYADSDYTAWVSGYDPRLDSIRIFRRTIRAPTPKRSGLHLSVGVGATYNGRLAPGFFIGVSYPITEIRF